METIRLIMKDGKIYKNTLDVGHRAQLSEPSEPDEDLIASLVERALNR